MENFNQVDEPRKKEPYGNARNEKTQLVKINSSHDSTAEETEHLTGFGLISNNPTYMWMMSQKQEKSNNMAGETVKVLLTKAYQNWWKIATHRTKKLSTPCRINRENCT